MADSFAQAICFLRKCYLGTMTTFTKNWLKFMENEVERYGITDVDGFAEKQRLEVARQEVHLQRAEEQLKVLRLKIAAAKRLARAEKILK